MFETKMTEMLGIEYPIQCGTMHGITTAEMVVPVAEAGGLCCLPAAFYPSKEELWDEIKRVQDKTDKPFGVNVGLFPEMTTTVTPEQKIEWVIDSGVKILETAGRSPAQYRRQIEDGGLIHIHKCARVRDAVKVDGLGVDIVSMVGTECGGHPSMEEVTSLVLIPAALDRIKAPLIAGGGFADGRGVIAALALGVAGVNLGTRFMATQECPIHADFKQKLIDTPETETVLVMKSLMNPSRVLRTPGSEKILELEAAGASFEELVPHISGKVSRDGWREGNLEQGMYPAGQVVGRINDILTIAELMERIIGEATDAKNRIAAL
ncbi:MAG: nitronate monooxygenase [Proteobacteria bacterium]|nr:nitronate monooxygenase [Pseudomonadota bacterium]